MTIDRRAISEVHHRKAVSLEARIYAVVCLHEPVFTSRREQRRDRAVCVICGDAYPCATVKMLEQ